MAPVPQCKLRQAGKNPPKLSFIIHIWIQEMMEHNEVSRNPIWLLLKTCEDADSGTDGGSSHNEANSPGEAPVKSQV